MAWLLFLNFIGSGIIFIKGKAKKALYCAFLSFCFFGGVGLGGLALAKDLAKFRFPPKNFTRFHSLFREFEEKNAPIAIFSVAGSETTTVYFYQKYLRRNGLVMTVIRAKQKPDDIKKIWQPLTESHPDSQSFIFGSSPLCQKELSNLKQIYFTKDYLLRCLFELPSKLSLTELEDTLRKIQAP